MASSTNRYGVFTQDLNSLISSYKTPQRVEEVPRSEFAASISSNPAPVRNPLGTKFTLSKSQGTPLSFPMTLAPVPADMAAASAKGKEKEKAGKAPKAAKAPTKKTTKKKEEKEKEVYVSGSSDNEMSVSDSFIDKDYKGEDGEDENPFANAFAKTKHFSESRFKKKHAAVEAAIQAGEFRSDDSREDDNDDGDDVVDASDEDEDEDEDEKHTKNEKSLFKGKKIEYHKKDFVKLPDYDEEFREHMLDKKGKIIENFDSDSSDEIRSDDLSSSADSSENSDDDPMNVDSPISDSSATPAGVPEKKEKKKKRKMINEDLDDITSYARHILAAPLPKHVRRKPADERRAPTQRARQAALAGKELLPSLTLPGEIDEEASTTDNNRQASDDEDESDIERRDADHFPHREDEESDEEDGANTDRISRAQANILDNMERVIGEFNVDGNPLGDLEVDKHVNAIFNLSHLLMNAFAEQQTAKNIQRSIDQGRTLVTSNSGSRKQREAVQESLRFLTEFTHTPLMLEIVTASLNK